MPNLDPITQFPIPEDYGNSGLDKFTAGMALANPISGWSDRRFAPNYKADVPEEYDTKYDPWSDPRITKYDPMHFVDSRSEAETTNIINDIERNITLQKRATGIPSIAGTVTGVFTNPLIMLPAIATSGSSIPAMMAAESGGEMISELLLHSQQPLRTKTESALNIGFAAAAAGLGGYVHKRMVGRSASREATDTAHGGDGMYAHPIPEEAASGITVGSRGGLEGASDMTMTDAKIASKIDDTAEATRATDEAAIAKEIEEANDIVTKATARAEAAHARVKELGCM